MGLIWKRQALFFFFFFFHSSFLLVNFRALHIMPSHFLLRVRFILLGCTHTEVMQTVFPNVTFPCLSPPPLDCCAAKAVCHRNGICASSTCLVTLRISFNASMSKSSYRCQNQFIGQFSLAVGNHSPSAHCDRVPAPSLPLYRCTAFKNRTPRQVASTEVT